MKKRCRLCGQWKSVEEFGRWKGQPDGIAWACRPCYRAYRLAWANGNRERKRELDRLGDERHREKRRAKNREYSRTHRQARNATQTRRRARKAAAVIVPYNRADIYDRDGGRCHICRDLVGSDFHIDHLIPIAGGGADTPENVAIAHPLCNHQRGAGRLPAQLRLVG